MQIAVERAKLAGVEYVLGDQRIEEIGAKIVPVCLETLKDMCTPSGWVRCCVDIARAAEKVNILKR